MWTERAHSFSKSSCSWGRAQLARCCSSSERKGQMRNDKKGGLWESSLEARRQALSQGLPTSHQSLQGPVCQTGIYPKCILFCYGLLIAKPIEKPLTFDCRRRDDWWWTSVSVAGGICLSQPPSPFTGNSADTTSRRWQVATRSTRLTLRLMKSGLVQTHSNQ